jgi:hypothetical protein
MPSRVSTGTGEANHHKKGGEHVHKARRVQELGSDVPAMGSPLLAKTKGYALRSRGKVYTD